MLSLLLACAGHSAEPKPDLVLVVVDTLRADHLGIYGHERPTSPEIDRLAREGTWFFRAYAHSGWTLPSFTSLLTGLLPHEHRVGRDGRDPEHYGRLPEGLPTLPERLGASGYASAAVVNNPFLAPEWGLQRGFDTYDWEPRPDGTHRSADQTVDAGLVWLGAQEKPAFLLLHLMEPHLPYGPAEADRGRFAPRDQEVVPVPFNPSVEIPQWQQKKARPSDAFIDMVSRLYDEEILAVDRAVGRLARALEARERPAVLVLTADHGEELWDHGGFEHGHTLLGELVRVPLIVSGDTPARGEIRTVVQHADLFRGLLALAGAEAPPDARGANLFALAAAGRWAAPRAALSENCLYGPERTAVVDDAVRMSIDLQHGAGEVWAVGADGSERERLQGAAQDEQGARLLPVIERLRGGLQPFTARQGPRIPSAEVFQQLRVSGHITESGASDLPSPEVVEMLRSMGYLRDEAPSSP